MIATRQNRNETETNSQLAAQVTQNIATRMSLEAERREWAHILRRSNPGRRTVIRLGLFARLFATTGV